MVKNSRIPAKGAVPVAAKRLAHKPFGWRELRQRRKVPRKYIAHGILLAPMRGEDNDLPSPKAGS
jgi:hypothetical protein